jgi:hypothetical protein
MTMQQVCEEFGRTIREAYERLRQIPEAESGKPLAPGKWSRKEVIGHLIDSASNNHQRFVRAQLTDQLLLPGYEQEAWVRCQGYQQEAWADLLALWRSYNLHLLHVVSRIPEEKLNHLCRVANHEPVTLRFLVEDYLRHLKHHVRQGLGE